jgi:hypothetical protein
MIRRRAADASYGTNCATLSGHAGVEERICRSRRRTGAMMTERVGILVRVQSGLGVLHQLTGVIAEQQGDISSVAIVDSSTHEARIYFEVELPGPPEALLEGLRALPVVKESRLVDSLEKIYGKRIIVMGGGAQVGQVAIGAISEADRHNIFQSIPFRWSASSLSRKPFARWADCRVPVYWCWQVR